MKGLLKPLFNLTIHPNSSMDYSIFENSQITFPTNKNADGISSNLFVLTVSRKKAFPKIIMMSLRISLIRLNNSSSLSLLLKIKSLLFR